MGGGKGSNKTQVMQEAMRQQQAAQYASSESANRQGLAANYNSAVTNYNNQLKDYASQVGGLGGSLSGLSIKDDEKFGDLSKQIANLTQTLGSSNFNTARPDFQSTVMSPYGAVQVDAPSLVNVDENLKNNMLSQLREHQNTLSGLQQQRKAEEDRINSFSANLMSRVNEGVSRLGGLTIADKGQLDELRRAYDAINGEISGFSSSILDEVMPSGFTNVNNALSTGRATLNDLFAQRSAEEQRVASYKTGLEGSYDQFNSALGGLTIADLAGIDALQKQIDASQLDASRFSSPLSPDFSQTLYRIQDLENQLGGLRNQRTQEEARIKAAQDQALYTAQDLQTQLGGANYYDRTLIDGMMNTLNTARNRIGGFTSALDFDFADATGRFSQVEGALQDLLTQRQGKLDEITGKASTLAGQVADTPLQNEQDLKKRLAEAQQLMQLLGNYSGSDLMDEREAANAAFTSSQNRLNELFDKRSNLEQTAQGLLGRVNNQSFYELANLADPRSELTALQEQVGLYGANSAQDELASIMDRLNKEQSRLETDAANVEARNQPVTNLNDWLLSGQLPATMTPEQYTQMLALLRQRDAATGQNTYSANTPSAFSRNLGIIRV